MIIVIYYFIGIKGSGMSSLAQIMYDLGYNIEGSDKKDHFFTEVPLIERGIILVAIFQSYYSSDSY